MDTVADLIISDLDVCLDKLGLILIAHERALDEYMDMFKAPRKQELDKIKMRRKLKASYYPRLLLIVHKKHAQFQQKNTCNLTMMK